VRSKIVSFAAAALTVAALTGAAARGEAHFAAGVPGSKAKPARTVTVAMSEGDGTMRFTPARLEVKKGEQVRFVLQNKGALAHEFRLATVKENDEHAVMMRQMPDMKHHEANGVTIDPGKTGEMLWRFTQGGTFEFACLIPGHREAGMRGVVEVK